MKTIKKKLRIYVPDGYRSGLLRFSLLFGFILVGMNLYAQRKSDMVLSDANLGSDWNIRMKIENAYSGMDCWGTDTYYLEIFKNGNSQGEMNRGNDYLENTDYYQINGVGINTKHQWFVKYSTTGYPGSCEYWKYSNTKQIGTKPLKAPIEVSATDSTDEISLSNRIKLTWRKGTDVPDNIHHYYIVKDYDYDNKISISGEEPREWIDINVGPDEIHNYSIWTYVSSSTWGGHHSDTITVTGSTFPQFTASNGQVFNTNQIKLSWAKLPDEVTSIKFYKEGEEIENRTDMNATRTTYDNNVIPGYKYEYSFIPYDDDTPYVAQTDSGYAKPNGRIKGTVKAPFGGPVEGAIVYAELLGDIPQSKLHGVYTDTTDASGSFDIRDIYYHEGATFKVYPVKGNHGFNPAYSEVDLDLQYPSSNIPSPSFIDTSSFTIQGKVAQIIGSDSAFVEGVEIYVNDVFRGTKTDEKGEYSLTVEEIGEYTIRPNYLDHSFFPNNRTLQIESDITSVSFKDTEVDTLRGYLLGGCEIYIGQAELRIYNSNNPSSAFDTLIITQENTGYYEVILPSREYILEVVSFEPEATQNVTEDDVLTFFGTYEVDLTENSVQQDLIYRRPPEIEVIGFPDPGCAPFDIPIVEQIVNYPLEIQVYESFGEHNCLTSSGYIVIHDDVKDNYNSPDTLFLENGIAHYNLLPGIPNTVGGGDHPYQKLITFHANVDGQTNDVEQYVLVEGNKPRENTFSTVSPEVPFLILRDPPGDDSYSYLSENTSFTSSMSLYTKVSGSVSVWNQTKVGVEQEAGVGVFIPYKLWGQVKTSMEIGASLKSQVEFGLQFSVENKFSTSGNDDITGEEGDVFIGSAINMIYSLTDVIEFNRETCEVETSLEIIMAPNDFATTFMYTEDHIRNVLIPQLEEISKIETNDSTIAHYENQIDVWQQTLAANAELKENALFIENRSFSAGAGFESSATVTANTAISIEFDMYIKQSVAVEAGLEVGGVGQSYGGDAKYRMEIGGSASTGISHTKTVGYYLNDDDLGDYFSVDIKGDLAYGTPVFDLVSGRSSCPWEPGTQSREGVQLTIDKRLQYDIEQDDEAVFKLTLGNTSQSDEDKTYSLLFLPESNPELAMINWNGAGSADGIQLPIPSGSSIDQTFTVAKGPNSNAYQDLKFALVSDCDAGVISDTVSFSVYFKSNCSSVVLSEPNENWLSYGNSDNSIQLKASEYELDNLNNIVFEYRNKSSNAWNTIEILDRIDMETNTTSIDWDISNVPDGNYDLRVKIACGDNNGEYSFSEIVSGTMDRSAPSLLGIPEPTDGLYENGDEISATFTEPINCFDINPSNVVLKDRVSGEIYTVGVGCQSNKILIVPLTEESFENQVLEVTLLNIGDQHGNVRSDSIIWEFDIDNAEFVIEEESDTDRDGITNNSDNCPFTENGEQSDSDGDGIGDLCDDDIDGDGVSNSADNCPYYSNPNQADSDGNGVGDVCELEGDGDQDSVNNEEDNCPFDANGNQSDIDNDGIGDACDEDRDGDGILNEEDNCPSTYNPNQEDENNDGVGDVCNTVTGLNEEEALAKTIIYPNPATHEVFLEMELFTPGSVSIYLFDMNGRQIDSILQNNLSEGRYKNSFDVSNLQQGIYFIHINSENKVVTKKLLIQ